MSKAPAILDYKPPSRARARRHTSITVWYTIGVAIACLTVLVAAQLCGRINRPIGYIIGLLALITGSGGMFGIVENIRRATTSVPFIEQNKAIAALSGIGSIALLALLNVLGVSPNGDVTCWIYAGIWLGGSVTSNWIALRPKVNAEECVEH